jgi:polyhydroxyalkanoate synthesis repressor PhaR
MAKRINDEIIIKKYANRRLYNTGTSTYVTLDDLAQMVRREEQFKVLDARTSQDITHTVLTQIIFEQEAKTENSLLPVSFLRKLISYYGDQMQTLVPAFLDQSLRSFSEQQVQIRDQVNRTFGNTPLAKDIPVPAVDEQVRRNTENFRQNLQAFSPFLATKPASDREPRLGASEIDDLKAQLKVIQHRLDRLDH